MRSVQVYVEGMRLELFQDENITVNSSQQNINDISKVMTDYTHTFNIPASNNNNRIFEHFYESDIDGSLDHNIRRSASIEIDLVPFRKGKISIEKASLKNGKAESYGVTFYGETLAIKDKMGDELLSDLEELSNSSFSYTPNNVLAEVQDDTFGAVKFPLITNRVLSYADGSSTDISLTGTNAILTDELFPAVSVSTIFDAIESRYDLQFNGTFLDDDRFKKAYLYCKNAQDFQFITKNVNFDVANRSADSGNYNTSLQAGTYLELENKVKLFHTPINTLFPNLTSGVDIQYFGGHGVEVHVTNVSDLNETYYIDVLENGVITRTIEGIGDTSNAVTTGTAYDLNNESLNSTFTFRVRATADISLDMEVIYTQFVHVVDSSGTFPTSTTFRNIFRASQTITLAQELDVTQYIPKMKASDMFKGVLNMFNLTCYGLGKETVDVVNDLGVVTGTKEVDVYQIEPLDDWYAKGAIVDITEHVDISDIEINKVPLYKNIAFNYKESKSITNDRFTKLFKRSFGNTTSSFHYDGGEFKIELPFENLMFNKFTDTNLQVGFNVDANLSSYIPEPTILYMYESLDADFRLNDGDLGTTNELTSYVPFGQDVKHNGTPRSLNFSADYSTLLGQPSQDNLFSNYYFPYLSNLYNLKNRNVKVKTVLPTSILSTLQLNDRLIIRNKRYLINSMSSNITTGEVNLDLLHDFRAVISEDVGGGGGTLEPLLPDLNAQCLDVRILFPRNAVSATITGSGVSSITPSTITEEQSITVCIPANDTATGLILTEDGLFNLALEDGSGDDVLQEEGDGSGTIVPYLLTITYTFADGSQASSQQAIIQQP
jgi:hypothetical protein